MMSPQERLATLRAKYTMTPKEVAAAFGLHRQSLRQKMERGEISLSGVKFSQGSTAPMMYNPTEVEAEVARWVARMEAQVSDD